MVMLHFVMSRAKLPLHPKSRSFQILYFIKMKLQHLIFSVAVLLSSIAPSLARPTAEPSLIDHQMIADLKAKMKEMKGAQVIGNDLVLLEEDLSRMDRDLARAHLKANEDDPSSDPESSLSSKAKAFAKHAQKTSTEETEAKSQESSE